MYPGHIINSEAKKKVNYFYRWSLLPVRVKEEEWHVRLLRDSRCSTISPSLSVPYRDFLKGVGGGKREVPSLETS